MGITEDARLELAVSKRDRLAGKLRLQPEWWAWAKAWKSNSPMQHRLWKVVEALPLYTQYLEADEAYMLAREVCDG